MDESRIDFITDDGEKISFTVLEETKLGGKTYLLVTDSLEDDEEGDAYILEEIEDESGDVVYEMIDDDNTLKALSDYFNSLLEDVDVEF